MERLSGTTLAAVGFGMGDVTLRNLLEEKELLPQMAPRVSVYVVIGNAQFQSAALTLVTELRRAGISTDYSLNLVGFNKQFKAADQSGAPYAVVLGEDEAVKNSVKIRNMNDRTEELIPRSELVKSMSTKFAL